MAIYAFGPFRLDTEAGILFRGADPVALGQRAIALLRVLVERPGVPVSKDALIEAAWLGLTVEESNLTVQMAALRRVFDQEPGGERWIETLPRRGYRFVGSVVARDQGDATGVSSKVADSGVTTAELDPASTPTPKTKAERRQLTIMSCELAGSAALSANMELEDLRDVIDAYHRCVFDTAGRFAGFVAKRIGDLALVFFGYPAAHEGDAEQAVRAGLELCAAVLALSPHADAPLRCRVGIATGMVIVSDPAGNGETQEYGLVGEAPNLAARLQGIAEPNMVVIADSTRRLLGNLFELDDLGPQELKGISGPTRAWAALRPASVEGRFDAMHASGLTDLVGREEELDLLLRRWSKAKSGEGQVVLLSGEAGIGKSRLTAALLERLATEPHTRLRYFCSPQHTDSAFYPIIGQMERAAKLAHDDTAQAKLDKLDTLLAQSSPAREDVALFAEILSLPNDGRYPTLELAPPQRRQRTLEALTAQMEALAQRSPVLMIFEDAHWADPTSLESFSRSVDRIRALGVLLIITHRPEFEPPWVGQPHVTTLTINRLGQREIAAMIDALTGNKPLLASVRRDIVEHTDGIPLFIEETTKAVLEAGGQNAERAVTSIPAPFLAVPASLHASLMARLDRLGSAKEVAQIGAVIGRDFSHALLAAVARKDDGVLQAALDGLTGAGLLFRQGTPPQATYLFKHGLVQDTAYGTLLRERRRALHARIAEVLETQFPETAKSRPELVARHCTEAGLIAKAAAFWANAGRRSLARSALVEAIAQISRALDQMATLTATSSHRQEQMELQVAVITPLAHVKGHSSPEVRAATERARVLIEQAEALGEPPANPLLLYSVLSGIWITNVAAFDGDVLRTLAAEFLALAEKQGATGPLKTGHSMMAFSLLTTGSLAQGRRHYDQAIALSRPPAEPRASSLSIRSVALWLLGYPEAALADTRHSLEEARDMGQAGTLFQPLTYGLITHFLCGNYTTAEILANELHALADEHDAVLWKPSGLMFRGWAFVETGRASEAVELIATPLAAYQSTGSTAMTPATLSLLAKSYADLGRLDDAWRTVDEAKSVIERTKETWFEPHVHLIAGEIALKSRQPNAAKAEACFEKALTVAREQQAKSWELRAATSMARLWRDQGKPQQARELLAPVYGWFTEGFDTRDLKEAKALLDELPA
jgi:class 3 adenylate cyclase/tetratricopeptide (TPR) repeat protein